jgi:hypothetical protein
MADEDKLKNELAPLIGHMTIEWNDIQATVFMIFHALMGTEINKSISIFFAIKSDTAQRDITLSLVREVLSRYSTLVSGLVTLFGAINKTAGRRNDFIHAIWQFPAGEGEFARVWLDVRRRLSGRDPKVEIESLRNDIGRLYGDIIMASAEVRRLMTPPKNALARPGLGWPPLWQEPAPNPAAHSNPDDPATPPPPPESSKA